MSIKVMNWVWEHSPAKGTELLMLLAIADNATDDGTNAYPSVRTLARKTRMGERSVQRIVRKLTEEGHLSVTERGGRNPNCYAVLMHPELSTPPSDWHPRQSATGDTDGTPRVSQLRHPTPVTAVTPEPSGTVQEPSSGSREHARGLGPNAGEEESHPDIDAVLDGLGSAWPLTPAQRRRLAPKVVEALAAGWSAQRLATHLGANPEGVKSPAAVLKARLEDLPAPVDTARAFVQRPTWCGACDEPSRTVERSDGRWGRCPQCHPQSRNSGRSKPPSTHRPESSTPTDHHTGRSSSSVPQRP
ncbi:helix-turn-helix protein [Halopolyspora algeriensis]|uniref:Helix-turn-helix protein n=1 Tax=Halopolyspora algeriensis TaxID=1500506 RepID=A0A368VSZ4_9ACTN|nr:helix-turn-helix domain-containing protein [Halopolyspora algeriensis]RCW45132.1 helix-turn-helix protein [Halopolyspora algeriensis]TQM53146.1 helix-turn-helix protein [Halopolyspora algeriensis]